MTHPANHGHYYVAGGQRARHLVTVFEKRRSSFEARTVCGRQVARSRVLAGDGLKHYTDWIDRLGDLLCDQCARSVTRIDPDLAWRETG